MTQNWKEPEAEKMSNSDNDYISFDITKQEFDEYIATVRKVIRAKRFLLSTIWNTKKEIDFKSKHLNTLQTIAVMVNGALQNKTNLDLRDACFIVHYAIKPVLEDILGINLYLVIGPPHAWLETETGDRIDAGLQFSRKFKTLWRFKELNELPEIRFAEE